MIVTVNMAHQSGMYLISVFLMCSKSDFRVFDVF